MVWVGQLRRNTCTCTYVLYIYIMCSLIYIYRERTHSSHRSHSSERHNCVRGCVPPCMRVCVCARYKNMYTYIGWTSTSLSLSLSLSLTHTHTVSVSLSASMHACMHACMYTYIHVYTYIHICVHRVRLPLSPALALRPLPVYPRLVCTHAHPFALPDMRLGHTHTCHKHLPRDRLLVRRRRPHGPLPLLPGVFGGIILTLYSVGAVPVDLSEILQSH
jgi:hypothetical protein